MFGQPFILAIEKQMRTDSYAKICKRDEQIIHPNIKLA